MRRHRAALELGMELAADEIRVTLELHHLYQTLVGARAALDETRARQLLAVRIVELETVPMPLADLVRAVDLRSGAAALQHARIRAEAHRAALVLDAALIRHQVDQRVRRVRRELRGVRTLE